MTGSATFLNNPLVVEIGSRVAVGVTGGLLTQLGANVVSVKPLGSDGHAKWQFNTQVTTGKTIVEVPGMQSPEVADLVARADIVLLSTDLDPSTIVTWNAPRSGQIVCDITAFGHSGPLAGSPMSEGLVEALSGIIDTTGRPDEPPSVLGTPLLDMHAAVYASGAIVTALRSRRIYGQGGRVEVALFDVGSGALLNFLPLSQLGQEPTRSGNRHPLYGPWGTFDAKDGTLLLCAVTDKHWNEICGVMGAPELATDPRFNSSAARLENHRAMDAVVQNWVGCTSVMECEERLLNVGIACGRVVPVANLSDEPNLVYRQSLESVFDSARGKHHWLARSPLRGSPVEGRRLTDMPNGLPPESSYSTDRLPHNTSEEAGERLEPFQGVRIVEVGQYTVAPLAGRLLGALGADVIKVEAPSGDALRNAAPFRDGESFIFALSNTDKRGIVLDLRLDTDREMLHTILKSADVLLENLKPGSLAKLGFDSDGLRLRHPNLIYCRISGFGATSAYPGRPAFDTIIQAMSGLLDITRPGGKPTKAGISASDNLGGQFGFLAIAAALELRDRTGTANHFDLSMQDATLWATQLEWDGHRSARPLIVRASDGFVAVEGPTEQLKRFFGTHEDAHSAFAHLRRDEIIAMLSDGVVGQPVLSATEVFGHPQTKARNILVDATTRQGTHWTVLSTPFKISSTDTAPKRAMGSLGETDEEVRRQFAVEN